MKDRSAIFIAMCDMLLAVLSVVIVAVSPSKAKIDGVQERGWFLVTVDWSVDIDADVDIWVLNPAHRPIFYGSRDVGCARLDADNRGFMDAIVTLGDGSKTKIESSKETIQLRCIEPGHFELATNLYADHRRPLPQPADIKVHAEIIGLNPSVHTVFSGDVVLNRVGQTQNITGFDLDREGHITLTPPQLEEVTASYFRSKNNGGYVPGVSPP